METPLIDLLRGGVPAIVMHNRAKADSALDIMTDIAAFFERSLAIADQAGIPRDRIALDPGIGFGKTPEQNLELLNGLRALKELGYPILLGTSRKSFIGLALDTPPDDRVEGTAATVAAAVGCGVADGLAFATKLVFLQPLRARLPRSKIIVKRWRIKLSGSHRVRAAKKQALFEVVIRSFIGWNDFGFARHAIRFSSLHAVSV